MEGNPTAWLLRNGHHRASYDRNAANSLLSVSVLLPASQGFWGPQHQTRMCKLGSIGLKFSNSCNRGESGEPVQPSPKACPAGPAQLLSSEVLNCVGAGSLRRCQKAVYGGGGGVVQRAGTPSPHI
jgi:hypothetical protein